GTCRVDRVRGLAPALDAVAVAVPAADALVAARAERPAAVLRAGPVAGEQHARDVAAHAGVVEHPVELVDGVRAEGVAHLGAVEGDAHDRQVAHAVGAALDAAVVGDVGEVEALDVAPALRVEDLRYSLRNGDVGHPPRVGGSGARACRAVPPRGTAAGAMLGHGQVRGEPRRRRVRPVADRGAAVRPRQRLGRGAAGRRGAERLPRTALVGRVRGLAPRAHGRCDGGDQGPLRLRGGRLPARAPDGADRVRLPGGGVAPQGARAGRARPAAGAGRARGDPLTPAYQGARGPTVAGVSTDRLALISDVHGNLTALEAVL